MNANQILATSELIISSYAWLNIDDLKLCFNQAKRGIYGQPYRIDGNIILSWLEQYTTDRINAADEISYAQHASIKADERMSLTFQELIERKKI